MYLVKCDCGCLYTLQEDKLENALLSKNRHCPNCGSKHDFDINMSVQRLAGSGLEISHVPNNAKIKVTFDLPISPDC